MNALKGLRECLARVGTVPGSAFARGHEQTPEPEAQRDEAGHPGVRGTANLRLEAEQARATGVPTSVPPPRPASLRPPGPAPLLAGLPPLSFLSAELQNGDQTSGGERGRLPDIPVV